MLKCPTIRVAFVFSPRETTKCSKCSDTIFLGHPFNLRLGYQDYNPATQKKCCYVWKKFVLSAQNIVIPPVHVQRNSDNAYTKDVWTEKFLKHWTSYIRILLLNFQFFDKFFDKVQKIEIPLKLFSKGIILNFMSEKPRFFKNNEHLLDISKITSSADLVRSRPVCLCNLIAGSLNFFFQTNATFTDVTARHLANILHMKSKFWNWKLVILFLLLANCIATFVFRPLYITARYRKPGQDLWITFLVISDKTCKRHPYMQPNFWQNMENSDI